MATTCGPALVASFPCGESRSLRRVRARLIDECEGVAQRRKPGPPAARILGEVTAPGQYPYVPRMTAETAVAIAGGYTPRAFRRNLILDRPEGGHIVRMSVPPSFPLHPGDTVNVQERWF